MGRKMWFGLAGMLLLILNGETAMNGARDGIALCLQSVVPSLLPFLILSGIMEGELRGQSFPLLRPLLRLLGIPQGGESIVLSGFFGGYPVGAQSISSLYSQGILNRRDAKRLLMFCSNTGPAFILGIVAGQFSSHWAGILLWLIQILSAFTVGFLAPGKTDSIVSIRVQRESLTEILERSIRVMAVICGWVVLFRILTGLLPNQCHATLRVMITGLLELTGGCCTLTQIQNAKLRFILASGMLSFGGCCVWLQTASICSDLGTASYIRGKLLQTLFSIALAFLVTSCIQI